MESKAARSELRVDGVELQWPNRNNEALVETWLTRWQFLH
jgi:hypothetical protein